MNEIMIVPGLQHEHFSIPVHAQTIEIEYSFKRKRYMMDLEHYIEFFEDPVHHRLTKNESFNYFTSGRAPFCEKFDYSSFLHLTRFCRIEKRELVLKHNKIRIYHRALKKKVIMKTSKYLVSYFCFSKSFLALLQHKKYPAATLDFFQWHIDRFSKGNDEANEKAYIDELLRSSLSSDYVNYLNKGTEDKIRRKYAE